MTRKKVKLAFIASDSARKATFKKRKKGLLKKIHELSTLCDIDAGAIIYSPYDPQPEVWPSPADFRQIIARFKGLSEMEQSKKMVNQEGFLRQRIVKAHEQLTKQRRDNREKEVTQVMFQGLVGKPINHLNMIDLNDLGWVIDQNLKEINKKIDDLKKEAGAAPPPPPLPTLPPRAPEPAVQGRMRSGGGDQTAQGELDTSIDAMQKQPWFMDFVNAQDQPLGSAGGIEDLVLPFGDSNPNPLWSNAFFP